MSSVHETSILPPDLSSDYILVSIQSDLYPSSFERVSERDDYEAHFTVAKLYKELHTYRRHDQAADEITREVVRRQLLTYSLTSELTTYEEGEYHDQLVTQLSNQSISGHKKRTDYRHSAPSSSSDSDEIDQTIDEIEQSDNDEELITQEEEEEEEAVLESSDEQKSSDSFDQQLQNLQPESDQSDEDTEIDDREFDPQNFQEEESFHLETLELEEPMANKELVHSNAPIKRNATRQHRI